MKSIFIKAIALLLFSSLLLTGCNKNDKTPDISEVNQITKTVTETEVITTQSSILCDTEITSVTEDTSNISTLSKEDIDKGYKSFSDFYDGEQEMILNGEKWCEEFLTTLQHRDYLNLTAFTDATSLEVYRFLGNVYISDWEIIDKKYKCNNGIVIIDLTVKMNVYDSDCDMFPVGEKMYTLTKGFDNDTYLFFHIADKPVENVLTLGDYTNDGNNAVNFCYRFTTELGRVFGYESITDFNVPMKEIDTEIEKDFLSTFMVRFCNRFYDETIGDANKPDNMALYAEKMFGITGYDFSDSPNYNVETDVLMLGFLSGYWKYATLSDYTVDGNTHTVVIDWYADKIYWAKAYTFKYTVRENDDGSFSMVSVEKLFGTTYEIASGST